MFDLDLFQSEADPAGVAFRDVLFLMVLSLVVVIFLLSMLINPVQPTEELPARTEIVVEAFWPENSAYDVDIWGMGPDGIPVGWGRYSAGPLLNLERDDRGKISDESKLNYEMMTVRKREPGEYVVNLHLYSDYDEPLPVPVDVLVTGTGGMGEIYSGRVFLDRAGEERTVVRFRLGEDGKLVSDSRHDLYKSILNRK